VADVHIGSQCPVCRKGSVIQTGQGKHAHLVCSRASRRRGCTGMWSLDGHRVLLQPIKRRLARRHRSFLLLGTRRVPQLDWSPPHLVFMLLTAAIFLFAIFLATRR
jgi:hypothetical protein